MINSAVKQSEIAPLGDDTRTSVPTYLEVLAKNTDLMESDPASEAAEMAIQNGLLAAKNLTSDSQIGKVDKAVVASIIASAKKLLADLIAKKRHELKVAKTGFVCLRNQPGIPVRQSINTYIHRCMSHLPSAFTVP